MKSFLCNRKGSSYLIAISLLILLPISCASAEGSSRLGIWVAAEGPLRSFENVKDFKEVLKLAADPAITDIYCQVYRDGRAWFPSRYADDSPYRRAKAQDFDPLADVIRVAHQSGKRVHA